MYRSSRTLSFQVTWVKIGEVRRNQIRTPILPGRCRHRITNPVQYSFKDSYNATYERVAMLVVLTFCWCVFEYSTAPETSATRLLCAKQISTEDRDAGLQKGNCGKKLSTLKHAYIQTAFFAILHTVLSQVFGKKSLLLQK